MADGDAVKNLEFTVRYAIREWQHSDTASGFVYNWVDDSGEDSFELFPTLEEAEADIRGRHR